MLFSYTSIVAEVLHLLVERGKKIITPLDQKPNSLYNNYQIEAQAFLFMGTL